jgi:hypothetical protein
MISPGPVAFVPDDVPELVAGFDCSLNPPDANNACAAISFMFPAVIELPDVLVVEPGLLAEIRLPESLPPQAANTRVEPRTAVAERKEVGTVMMRTPRKWNKDQVC